MKPIQYFFTRHFIAAPISFGSWLYFMIGAGFNFFTATGLLIAIYFTSSFTIKQIQISSILKEFGMSRSEYNYIHSQLKIAKQKLKRLNSYYGRVRSVQAFKQLHEMNLMSKRIMNIVKANPQKFYHVENFFYAHLDSAVELTSTYVMLVNQPLKDEEIQTALQNTRETLTHVSSQLEQDLRNAIATDMENLKMEIDFVDMTMKQKKPVLEMKGETKDDRE